MKTRVSIILVALCGILLVLLAPQKYFYGWALGQIFDGEFQTYWKDGVAQLEQPHFKWPEKDFERSWKTSIAVGIVESYPVAIHEGTIEYQGYSLNINGLYSPKASDLTVSHDNVKLIHVLKESGKPAIFNFSNAPIAFLKPFFPLNDFSGTLVEGRVDENLKGDLLVRDLSYAENNFNLSIPSASMKFNGKEVDVLGNAVSLSCDGKPLWTVDPLPMKLTLDRGIQFEIHTDQKVYFTDQRFQVAGSLVNLSAKGSLTPVAVSALSFEKSSLKPVGESSIISMRHSVSCDYKDGKASTFTIAGNEMSFDLKMGKERSFVAEFSEKFLEQFGLETLPMRQLTGSIKKEKALWHVDSQFENGTLHAYLPSLLEPEQSIKEVFLSLNDFYLLKNVKVHFAPKANDPYYFDWQAGFKDLALKGTGTKDEFFNFTIAGGGPVSSWRELLSLFDPGHRALMIPLDGTCTINEGHINKDLITIDAALENGTLVDLTGISGKLLFSSANDSFELNDVTANYKYNDRELLVFLPKISYDKDFTFDGWVADQTQDFMRLSGVASLSDNSLLHVKFDRTKTHVLNIVPDHFTLTVKDWKHVQKMEFQGKGPFKTPLFEDFNRLTLNEDWNISFHYNCFSASNTFEVKKGQLNLSGTIDDFTHLTIKDMSLNTPSVSLAAMGTIDLNNLTLHLDPLDIAVNFEKGPVLTQLPIEGSFDAQGVLTVNLDSAESHLTVVPKDLRFGMLSVTNAPFNLHQNGDNFTFNCSYVFNDTVLNDFACSLNKQGLKAESNLLSFFVGNSHFEIEKSGFCMKCKHSPSFSLIEPIQTGVEVVKAFLPFSLPQIQGGMIAIDKGHCTIKDTVLFGKEVDKVNFDFEITENNLLALKNIALNNEEELIKIAEATLTFADNHLQKVEFPKLAGKNINLSPVVLTKLNLENFESEWPFNNFSADGDLAFTNLLPMLAKSINQDELHELAHIDAKWFLPNQGECKFAANESNLRLNELHCFSSGKMIRFELQNEESVFDWDGAFSLPLKLKPQHLSFKWSELFSLNVQGTLDSPLLELRRK